MSPRLDGFIGGSNTPLSYRSDRQRTINLYAELDAAKSGPNVAWLRRRPGLILFSGAVTGGGGGGGTSVFTSSVDYLVVGGGGGAGNTGVVPGGGGGGAVIAGSVVLVTGSYAVVIGAAGAVSGAGGTTTWNGHTSTGGGRGGEDAVNANAGGTGASGGGAATSYFDGSTWTPFAGGVGSQGSNGGNSDLNAGAGGGGAGGSGSSAIQNNGGGGGVGIASAISGASVAYGSGGAGVGLTTRGAIPSGSYGSGGSSSSLDPFHAPIGDQVAAKKGVVILRYITNSYTATGGTITTSGIYTIHTFTSSGTFAISLVVPTVATTAGDVGGVGGGGAIHYCPAQGRCFVISTGGTVYEIFADGSLTKLGTVAVGAFRPSMSDNGTLHQLLIVSGYTVYILDLVTNVLAAVSSGQITTPVLSAFSDGYFLILNTYGILQWSAVGNGLLWDGLDIAANSATSDPWTSLLVNHRELWLVGSASGQVWVPSENADLPFQLSQGAVFQQGVIAPFTLQRCDNSSFWVGQNEQGRCVVFRASGYTPQRISTHPVEVSLGSSAHLESAIACTFQSQGHTFYQIYVPDLQTSWVYDVSTEVWVEWAILVDDTVEPWVWRPWPVQMTTFAFNENLVVGPETALVAALAWESPA